METFQRLPAYLKQYCVEQDYDAYTARDHAVWRFIMRQNRNFFRKHAVPVYEEGLQKTGISIDRIPRISEMDQKLSEFGWGAIAVNGFIPPAAFLEFQALGVLAIACDMRTAEHLEYTPAPDIVHEASGHAPIIVDPKYADYLRRYARMAQQAIFSREDIDVYEAVRYLSDIKENPDTNVAEITRAEERLQAAQNAISHVSEATKVGRMAWWTVEYGLVGPIQNPLIYGAGLLSSVGESQNCLSAQVKKIPLTVDCVEQGFDITKPQPQLFVAEDMDQLSVVLEKLEQTMAFTVGGKLGLERALASQMVNTVVLDSGLEVAGQMSEFQIGKGSGLEFLKFTGPAQLAFRGQQLLGHGRNRHPSGFSSPLGRFAGLAHAPSHKVSDDELRKIGIVRGRKAKLEFVSGFIVDGIVSGWHREAGNLLYISFRNATVRRGEKIFFEPSWGDFDLAIGEMVESVRGGPANRIDFGEYGVGNASTKPGRSSPYSDSEISLFDIYAELREMRRDKNVKNAKADASSLENLKKIATNLSTHYRGEWLAALEVFEIANKKTEISASNPSWLKDLRDAAMSDAISHTGEKLHGVIDTGLQLLKSH